MLKKYKNKTAIQNRDVGRGALSEKNRELIINWRTFVLITRCLYPYVFACKYTNKFLINE